ncbi:MAG TPA: hypothetical protein VGM88_04235 [Kofleriaceae bacterium]|jgi:hypothetical protein
MAVTDDQNFIYSCGAGDGSNFLVNLPAARANNTYFVTASLENTTNIYGFEMPNTGGSDRSTTQFRVVTTAPVTSGDKIEFHVYEQTPPAPPPPPVVSVTAPLGAASWAGTSTLAGFNGNSWTLSISGGSAGQAAVELPIPVGATLTGYTIQDNAHGGVSNVNLKEYASTASPTVLDHEAPVASSSFRTLSYTLSTPVTVTAGMRLTLFYQCSASTGADLYGGSCTYTLP